jgi:hypothetical protein
MLADQLATARTDSQISSGCSTHKIYARIIEMSVRS